MQLFLAKGQTAEHRLDWEAADIPCKAVYQWPWELPSMLNQTVITNKSRLAWSL